MITSVVWIPYGAANPLPEFYNPTEEEIENLVKKNQISLDILNSEEKFDDKSIFLISSLS